MSTEPERHGAVEGSAAEHVGVPAEASPGRRAQAAEAAHRAALRFIGRLAQLDHAAVHATIETWREAMRTDSRAWFAAEEAVARAVVASGRQVEQRPLLGHVADAFAYRVWYRDASSYGPGLLAPEVRIQGTEASGQYVGTLAMLALLVRDQVDPAAFELLYRPFAALIPVAELGRE
jgi:hypothetical protein